MVGMVINALAQASGVTRLGSMSPAACAGSRAGPRSNPSGTAELLCALSYVGIQLGRTLGLAAEGLEAVFYGALLKDVGCGACGPLLAPFFPKTEPAPGIGLVVVDPYSPSSMLAWAKGQMRLDPTLPARLAFPPLRVGPGWGRREWSCSRRSVLTGSATRCRSGRWPVSTTCTGGRCARRSPRRSRRIARPRSGRPSCWTGSAV